MYCSNCGSQLTDNAKFCNECGNPTVQNSVNASKAKFTETTQKTISPIDIDSLKTESRIMGDDFKPSSPAPEYEKYPHPYHKLGGWLGFIAYAQPIAVVIMALVVAANFFISFYTLNNLGALSYVGGVFWFANIIQLIGLGVVSYFCLKFSSMIRHKDPKFLRFYEQAMLIQAGIYVALMIFSSFQSVGEHMASIVQAVILFFIWTTYYRKSVRVRTYFGTDEYLRHSIFFNNTQSPEPADVRPYAPTQPAQYTPTQNHSAQSSVYSSRESNKPTNTLGWLISVTAISWMLTGVALRVLLGTIFNESYSIKSTLFSLVIVLIINVLLSMITYFVWRKSKKSLTKTIILTVGISIVIAVVLYLARYSVAQLTSSDILLVEHIAVGLSAYLRTFPMAALNLALSTYLLTNRRKIHFIICRAVAIILLLPICYSALITGNMGLMGLFGSFGIAELVVAFINIVAIVIIKMRHKKH